MFGPGTVTWRVNREGVLLAGGGRALLLQVAHPLVAAGVAAHSDYDRHPWRRLERTLSVTTAIVFGDPVESRRASERLWAVHGRVDGTAAGGTPYRARDPDLLLWVWATLVDSSLLVYRRCVGELGGEDLARYHAEQVAFAEACGVPAGMAPADPESFAAYWERMLTGELRVGEDARRIAAGVLRPASPPPLPAVLRPPIELLTAGLLPPGVRAAYGLTWSPGRERALDAALAAVRAGRALTPPSLRWFPAARRAARRERVTPGGA